MKSFHNTNIKFTLDTLRARFPSIPDILLDQFLPSLNELSEDETASLLGELNSMEEEFILQEQKRNEYAQRKKGLTADWMHKFRSLQRRDKEEMQQEKDEKSLIQIMKSISQ